MTYITYRKRQYSDYKKKRKIKCVRSKENQKPSKIYEEGIHMYRQPPKKIPPILPKPNFMPSYLVRIFDMKVVKGSEVREGYCALSYSWDQSGEITQNTTTGYMERNDQGKHKIIYPARTVRKKPRGRKRIPSKAKFVKFEGLIQEICKDFNIKYIWYDQMCINQNHEEEKHGEIKQMHNIYRNAYCTIALVPELTVDFYASSHDFLDKGAHTDCISFVGAQWMKRMWTLEEAILSSKIVFIGESIHCWYHQLSSLWFPIFRKSFSGFNIGTILHYAHLRTSTKDHDHVFALANIFPDVMKEIKIDYDRNIQDLMIQFYGLLAKQDISILCFGRHDRYETMFITDISSDIEGGSRSRTVFNVPMQKFELPSWTGVYGEHKYWAVYKTSFKNYIVDGRVLQVTCAGMTNDQHDIEKLDIKSIKNMLPPFPRKNRKSSWSLVIRLQAQGSANEKFIHVLRKQGRKPNSEDYVCIATKLHILSYLMPIKKTNLFWNITYTTKIYFYNLTEPLEGSAQYVLLAGVPFKRQGVGWLKYTYYSLIKKDGDYYKAIGLCKVGDRNERNKLFDDIALQEQIFKIH